MLNRISALLFIACGILSIPAAAADDVLIELADPNNECQAQERGETLSVLCEKAYFLVFWDESESVAGRFVGGYTNFHVIPTGTDRILIVPDN